MPHKVTGSWFHRLCLLGLEGLCDRLSLLLPSDRDACHTDPHNMDAWRSMRHASFSIPHHSHVLQQMRALSHPCGPWGVGAYHTYPHRYKQGLDSAAQRMDVVVY